MPSLQNSKATLDFLDTIGSNDRGDSIAMNATAKALIDLGSFLIETATNNLQRGANIASGATAASMKAVNIETQGTAMSLDIEILDTYKFLDKGVKGVGGVGSGKYSFKTARPSKKMATAILKWVRKRGLSGKIKYKPKSKNEAKNVSLRKASDGSDNLKGLAYAMAASIKKKGIKPTGFFTKAVNATKERQQKVFGEAFKLDIIETLKNN